MNNNVTDQTEKEEIINYVEDENTAIPYKWVV